MYRIASPMTTRVLVIDDNDDFRKLALLWFQIHNIEAEGAANGARGLEMQRARPADVIVTDIFMPEKDGIETIQELRREFPGVQIIAMTGKEVRKVDVIIEGVRLPSDKGHSDEDLWPEACSYERANEESPSMLELRRVLSSSLSTLAAATLFVRNSVRTLARR